MPWLAIGWGKARHLSCLHQCYVLFRGLSTVHTIELFAQHRGIHLRHAQVELIREVAFERFPKCIMESIAIVLLQGCGRSGKALALLYLDIDHFKRINDTHGHAVGDAVLCEFAARLLASIRATDFAARLGGDEFVVLVDDIDAPDAPQAIAEKLIASLHNDIVVGEKRLRVTTSIGIAEGTKFTGGPDELLRRADAALYEAKVAGRNTWRIKRSQPES